MRIKGNPEIISVIFYFMVNHSLIESFGIVWCIVWYYGDLVHGELVWTVKL